MEVSTFELIFKPQSPAAPTGVAAVDRVIQGYFLAITNLEDKTFKYALDFVATPVADPLRSLSGNTVVFVDTPGSNNQQGVLNGALSAKVFRPSTGFVEIPAHGTALVAVLPSAFGPVPGDATPLVAPTFEARGFVRIRLPALRSGPFPSIFNLKPQSDKPVKVLLTPQHRATFLTAAGAISDQTQTALPNASGAALNELKPEKGFVLTPAVFETLPPELARGVELLDPPERAALIGGLMAELAADGADLKALNAAMKAADIGLAVERRALVPA
jgi:hypothetical protein